VNNVFTTIPFATTVFDLEIFMNGTFFKDRKFLPRAFSSGYKVGEKITLENGSSFAGSEVEQIATVVLLCFFPNITRHKNKKIFYHTHQTLIRKPAILYAYGDFVGTI
jgi:hypothetical protein